MQKYRFSFLETPPRAWGRPYIMTDEAGRIRNTPTCVGKTSDGLPSASQYKKHPHVRGEDAVAVIPHRAAVETPPRAWGRLPHDFLRFLDRRNTPTCVGKTGYGSATRDASEKHPHVRGEDNKILKKAWKSVETPPRAWGRLEKAAKETCAKRNTPTCVGKTGKGLAKDYRIEKHPHVRGEDEEDEESEPNQ